MPTVLIPTAYRGPTRGVAEVEATTDGADQWSTIVAEDSFRPGSNEVQVYVVSRNKEKLTLSRPLNAGVAKLASKPRSSRH